MLLFNNLAAVLVADAQIFIYSCFTDFSTLINSK